MILPAPTITPEALLRILSLQNCKLYLRPESTASAVDKILQNQPSVRTITAPGLDDLFKNIPAQSVKYQKSWEDGKDDPWLIFHTSGTTGQS